MKIAYLTNEYPHVRHTFIRREVVAVEAHGIEVERFSVRPPGTLVDPADRAEQAKTHVLLSGGKLALLRSLVGMAFRRPVRWLGTTRLAVRMGRRSQRGLLRHFAYLAEACLLVDRLRTLGVQHVHAHFGTNSAAVALLTHRLGGPTYSLTIHGSEEWDSPAALSLQEKYDNAAFVAAVTEYARCQVLRWSARETWPRVHVVRCGIDEMFLKSPPQPVTDVPRFVMVGAIGPQKGQLQLVEAVAALAAEGVACDVVLVGDGPFRKPLEEEIARLKLGDRVRITGWQSNAEVREHILAARALVVPSMAENLPVVVMEALALGRPVVCAQLAGIPELVEPGVCGWLVPPCATEPWARTLKQVLQTPVERLTEMGRAGAARVAELHDATREAARLAKRFETLSAGRGPIP